MKIKTVVSLRFPFLLCLSFVLALASGIAPAALRTREKPLELSQYTPPTNGLVGWWRGEGNGYDSAGGQNGVLVGVRFEPGVIGRAFSFSGNPNRVYIPDGPGLQVTNSFSIAAWAYPKAASWHIVERTCITCKHSAFCLGLDNGSNVVFEVSDYSAEGTEKLSAPITFGQWKQVTATFDGERGEMKLYIGGALVAEKKTSITPAGAYDARTQPGIGIGNNPNTGGFPFIGLVDEVLLYSRALSAEEVKRLATLKPSS
jgi:hypothetical protein